jgi:hypothetical protein
MRPQKDFARAYANRRKHDDPRNSLPWEVIEGEAEAVLETLPTHSHHAAVTSPPYFRLRDFSARGQSTP